MGGSIEAASHYEGNACLREISSVSADIYMVFYLNDGADLSEGKYLTVETAPYVSSIVTKVLEWECGRQYLPDTSQVTEIIDGINTIDSGEQTMPPTFRLREKLLRQTGDDEAQTTEDETTTADAGEEEGSEID